MVSGVCKLHQFAKLVYRQRCDLYLYHDDKYCRHVTTSANATVTLDTRRHYVIAMVTAVVYTVDRWVAVQLILVSWVILFRSVVNGVSDVLQGLASDKCHQDRTDFLYF